MGKASRKKKSKVESLPRTEISTSIKEFDKVGEITLPPHSYEAKAINAALREMHGVEISSQRPKYRITWSTISSEIRFGTYSLYYMEHIFLRDETGYVRVAKYPDYPDKWVLEKLVYAPIQEIPESFNGHYELVYPFQDKHKNYLPPDHSVAEIVIWSLENPEKAIEERLRREDERKLQKEIEYFEDVLEDRSGSVLVTALRDREAVTVPRNYETPKGVIGVTKL